MKKYILTAVNSKGEGGNIYKDGRTFKTKSSARHAARNMQELLEPEIKIEVINEITDTERLEFMYENNVSCYRVCDEWTTNRSTSYYKTPREAIDATMKETK
jgi:hypothetical protein